MDNQLVDRIRLTSSKLFEEVAMRVHEMQCRVDQLKSKVNKTEEILAKITSDPNKLTRFVLPSIYPVTESSQLRYKAIQHESIKSHGYRPNVHSKPISRMANEDFERLEMITRSSIDFVDDLVELTGSSCKNDLPLCTIDQISSVSSLLVFGTYENRLTRRDGYAPRSIVSDNSLHDYVSKHQRSKAFSVADRAKSSSGEDLDTNLGPVPRSILQYHQDSFIEPEVMDAIDILDYEDDGTDLLTGNLPDILPELTGIVQDVSVLSNLNPIKSHEEDESTPKSPESRPPTISTDEIHHLDSIPPPPPPPPTEPLHSIPKLSGSSTIAKPLVKINEETKIEDIPPKETDDVLLKPTDQPVRQQIDSRDALFAEIRMAANRSLKKPQKQVVLDTSNDKPNVKESGSSTSNLTPGNPRESLLASIRDAAGKPLRQRSHDSNAKSRHIEEKMERKRQDSSSSGADLMSDLVNKLRARRDGISGTLVESKSLKLSDVDVTPGQTEVNPEFTRTNVDNPMIRALGQISSLIPDRKQMDSSSSDDDSTSTIANEDADWN